jgi:hypothetical protein
LSKRGRKTIIDKEITNKNAAVLVDDTRVFRSDHYFVLSKIKLIRRWKKSTNRGKICKETYKVHLLKEDSVKYLYHNRVNKVLQQNPISRNINTEWESLKDIIKAATESLGKRRRRYKNRGLSIWNDEIAQYIKEKKQAYLKYLNTRSDVDRADYKRKSAIVKRETLKINREHWRKYVADLEYDVYGHQDKAFKILKDLNKETNDNVRLNPIKIFVPTKKKTYFQYHQMMKILIL